jgi:chromatin modification-related protein VID21
VDVEPLPTVATTDSPASPGPETPPSLTDLFPDLATYDGPMPPEDGKAHKRLEEGQTSGHRVAHTSRIMDIRPLLISTLQPARNAFDGEWDLNDGPYYEDPKGSTNVGPEVVAATSSVFGGRGLRPPNPGHVTMQTAPAAQNLRPHLTWSDEEDAALHRLVTTYPFHWQLIADSFNSEIVTIPTEKRTPYDCWDRWYWNWGGGRGQVRPDAQVVQGSGTQTPAGGPMSAGTPSSALTPAPLSATTAPASAVPPSASSSKLVQTPQGSAVQGTITVPTLPSGTVEATEGGAPPPPGLSKREARAAQKHRYEGSKKAIRHQVLYDAMRRLARRRDANKQKNSGA